MVPALRAFPRLYVILAAAAAAGAESERRPRVVNPQCGPRVPAVPAAGLTLSPAWGSSGAVAEAAATSRVSRSQGGLDSRGP